MNLFLQDNPMTQRYAASIFLFRRDLRLPDNTGLERALELSKSVAPLFIFDPRQVGPHPYRSEKAFAFMLDSLQDLSQELLRSGGSLGLLSGRPDEVIVKAAAQTGAQAVFTNRDYTPFSRERDRRLEVVCRAAGLDFYSIPDALLHEPEVLAQAGKPPYRVFTPFFRFLREFPVRPPSRGADPRFLKAGKIFPGRLPEASERSSASGGRAAALKILQRLSGFSEYALRRDRMDWDGTTHLSAHLKFGTVSMREVHAAVARTLGTGHALIRELYWRDFFCHVAYAHPKVFGRPFNPRYENLPWSHDRALFNAWCEGRTGFPVVDAGMRELNATGFMHNRARMITASFLTKDLHLDWRWGERYFAQKLADYDPCVNNGNWQWSASVGCDAQPYFRVFNPWNQQEKYDPEGAYVRRWVPELENVPADLLPKLGQKSGVRPSGYPAPIVDHARESAQSVQLFRKHRSPI
jgi:deoxyribodipyrimidine photo-lyase